MKPVAVVLRNINHRQWVAGEQKMNCFVDIREAVSQWVSQSVISSSLLASHSAKILYGTVVVYIVAEWVSEWVAFDSVRTFVDKPNATVRTFTAHRAVHLVSVSASDFECIPEKAASTNMKPGGGGSHPLRFANNIFTVSFVCSCSQEIRRLLWNPEVHYRVQNSPPLVPVLSEMHPVHTLPPCSRKIQSNIIFPSTPRSSEWSLPFRFSDRSFVCTSHLSPACYMPLPWQ
jgi:hypothetical protein